MPAKSKSQQRFFGMIHAYKNGKLDDVPDSVREAAEHISDEDARDFAKTKHRGLPEKRKKMKKRAGFTDYELGFLTKCAELGLNAESAYSLLSKKWLYNA